MIFASLFTVWFHAAVFADDLKHEMLTPSECELRLNARRTDWDAVGVPAVLRRLSERGIPMNLTSIEKKNRAAVETCLREDFGVTASAPSFKDAVLGRYQSWEKALEAAGLDRLAAERARRVVLSGPQVAIALRHLHKFYPSLKRNDMTDYSQEIRRVLAREVEIPITGRALYEEALRNFGSWVAALEYAGFDTSELVNRTPDIAWTPERLRETLHYLSQNGVDLSAGTFLLSDAEVLRLSEALFGQQVSALSIWRAAQFHFAGWPEAVYAAHQSLNAAQEKPEDFPALWRVRLPLGPREQSGLPRVGRKARLMKLLEESPVAHNYPDLMGVLKKYLREHESLDERNQVIRFVYRQSWSLNGFEALPRVLDQLQSEAARW